MPTGLAQSDEPKVYECGDYSYIILEDGTAEIVDYSGEDTTLEIPETIDGQTVTSIGAYSFHSSSPTSVTSIGKGAFYACRSLTSITLPDSITSIGKEAFKYSSLTSINIPDSVTYIGEDAFKACYYGPDLTVEQGSAAEKYAKANGIYYDYPDESDWLDS